MAMTVRVDQQLDAALTWLAEVEGVSRQEVIRRAVLDRARRQGQLDRALALDADLDSHGGHLLDRLGKA